MIEITSHKQLSLLFPKSNKLMQTLLQSASPEQLQGLSEAKDIKAILSQLMHDTLDVNKSNKIILEILKNSTLFKEFGNFPKELKALVDQLNQIPPSKKSDTLQSLTQHLQRAQTQMHPEKQQVLQDFVKHSGVFMESKFLDTKAPLRELNQLLNTLHSHLSKSDHPALPAINKQLTDIIQNTAHLKSLDTSSLQAINSTLLPLISNLDDLISKVDSFQHQHTRNLVAKLETLMQDLSQNATTLTSSQLKNTIEPLLDNLQLSRHESAKSLLAELSKLHSKVQNIAKEHPSLPLISSLATQLQSLELSTLNPRHQENLQSALTELKTLSTMQFEVFEQLPMEKLTQFLTGLSTQLSSLPSTQANTFVELIEKILSALKPPQQILLDYKIPQDIKSFLNHIHQEFSKLDPLFSKTMDEHLSTLKHFSSPAHLLDNTLLKDQMQQDMKSMLLAVDKELSNTSLPTTVEMTKSVDKLLMHIDYFQLMSHLSNASILYLPYHWDGLENGQFSFKHKKDGTCFCEIDLELKEYGKLNMILQLFDDNQLNMMIYTQKEELRTLFKENMKELRTSLTAINVMARNIQLHKLELTNESKAYQKEQQTHFNELGFEVKG